MSEENNNVNEAPVEQAPVDSQVEGEEASQDEVAEEAELADLEAQAAAAPSKAEKKAIEKQLKKFKLKIDGKDEDFEIDLNNEEELKKHLQMSKASAKRMSESAELRKSAEQFIEMLRTNPRKVLADPNIGVDMKKMVQEYLDEEIERSSKSPEQLEKEKLQAELETLREKYKKDEEDRKSNEFKRLQAEQEEKIQTNIEAALNSGNLPKSPYTVKKMAEMMMLALENNIDLEPKDLVPLLKKQMNSDIKDLFSASSDDVLEELVGKDNISRLRKRTIAKVKQSQVAQTASSVKPTGTTSKNQEENKSPKISMRDFLRNS